MKIVLYHAVQESGYYFKGCAKTEEIADLFSETAFSAETMEKAAIHKKVMEQGLSPFSVTLRIDPDSQIESLEDKTVFTSQTCQICNGASRIAALCQLPLEARRDGVVTVNLFLADEEKMRQLCV